MSFRCFRYRKDIGQLQCQSQAGGKYIEKEKAYEIISHGLQMLRDGKSRQEAKSAVVTWSHEKQSRNNRVVVSCFSWWLNSFSNGAK